MGHGANPHRWTAAGDGMSSKFVFDMSEFDFEQLAGQLERCGAKPWGTLDDEEFMRRMTPWKYIRVPAPLADMITAALLSVPQKRRRPKLWSRAIEARAFGGLLEGEPINALAREIAAATGQSLPTARRRLQQMKINRQIEEMRRVSAEQPEGGAKID